MRSLVTGATGHLGSFLTRYLLQRGHEVAVLIRPESDPWRIADELPNLRSLFGDLSSIDRVALEIADFAPTVVFHLGWYGVVAAYRDDPRQITDNLIGSLRLLEIARDCGAQAWIGIGSQAEYGACDDAIDESTPVRPTTGYGVTKLSIGMLTSQLCRVAGMRHVWLRLLATYGPMDDERRLIPGTIRRLLAGEKPSLTPGEQCWDYLYIDDFVTAVYAAAMNEKVAGTFVLGSGETHRIRDIVERIRDSIDSKLALGWGEIPYGPQQIMQLRSNPARFMQASGWRPRVSMDVGLDMTVNWYRNFTRA